MMANWLRPLRRCLKEVPITVRKRSSYSVAEPDSEILKLATINPPILRPYFDPIMSHEDYFNLKDTVSVEDMFEARVHYGHKIGTLRENMKWAIYGERLGVCIFDLDITQKYLIKALNFLACMSYQSAIILFVTSNRSHILPVEEFAKSHGQYAHARTWKVGTFSNSRGLFGAPIRLPDVVVFTSTLTSVLERHPAVIDCAKMAIPTVGIVDSNADPNYITYPIPGNDDSVPSLNYYLNAFGNALNAGQKARVEQDQEYENHVRNRGQQRREGKSRGNR